MKQQLSQLKRSLKLAVLLLLLIFSSPSYASIVANFDDGISTTLVDGYSGIAGNGWLSAWSLVANGTGSPATAAATINTSSVLTSGGGNYLTISFTSPGSGSFSGAAVSRKYAGTGGSISLTESIQYSFVIRPESTTDFRYVIFDATSATNQTSSSCSWIISGQGGNWIVYDGKGDGTADTGEISTIAITQNVNYRFSVVVDPTTKLWSVKIYNADTSTLLYDSLTTLGDTLGMRSGTLGGYLNIGIQDPSPTTTSNTYSLSVDSISITQVPEPSTIALLFCGCAALGIIAQSRRKKATA